METQEIAPEVWAASDAIDKAASVNPDVTELIDFVSDAYIEYKKSQPGREEDKNIAHFSTGGPESFALVGLLSAKLFVTVVAVCATKWGVGTIHNNLTKNKIDLIKYAKDNVGFSEKESTKIISSLLTKDEPWLQSVITAIIDQIKPPTS